MPKREDIKKVMVIGSGQLLSVRQLNLIIQGVRPVGL